ncbi:MFS transporter [uncultured Methylobacterium sp.]|jgi:PPP family 3-phenylpropionic acid transporter|uniref:MFS transporter n=1 Tax=uncultured Methylobacterium sp. TaxID=157278 RepID=UPI002605AD79|nr:MFS transporter [uncultured Methylobacterium sp.]
MPALPTATRLGLLYALVFAGIGVAMPFLPLWLASLALAPETIGFLLALPIGVKILATAPLMGLVDRGVAARRILVAGSLGLFLTYAAMPAAAGFGWPFLAVLIAANAVAAAPLVPCLDYLSLAAVRREPRLAYARIRLGGSLGFLAASLGGGWLLGLVGERAGATVFLAVLALVSAAGSAVFLGLRRGEPPAPARSTAAAPARPGRMPPALLLAMGAAALVQASHAAVYAFGSIQWAALGLSPAAIGLAWAVGVVAEIAVFAVIGRVPALNDAPFRLLVLGAAAALLRWAGLVGTAALPAAILPLQVLHGLTFGATQLGVMAALSRLAPDGARGAAQGRYSALAALASALATVASGAAFRIGGGPAALALMLPVAGLGLALALAAGRARRSLD